MSQPSCGSHSPATTTSTRKLWPCKRRHLCVCDKWGSRWAASNWKVLRSSIFIAPSHFPIGPGNQIAQRGPAIMPPCQRWALHLSQRTNPAHPPARELIREVLRAIFRRSQAHRRDLSAHRICPSQHLIEIAHSFYIDEAI